ncbi:MAG: pantoate kinase [Methermicoccaceae archaeon]
MSSSTTRAYAPAHITGFFAPHVEDNPEKSGSVGCGITLSARGWCEAGEGQAITYRGKDVHCEVVERTLSRLSLDDVGVALFSDVPVGYGFGMSGALALAAGIAASHHLKKPTSLWEVARAAHVSEVECGTGLGDVVAQCTGGLVMRLGAGIPPYGTVERIPTPPAIISYVARGGMDTSSVLSHLDLSSTERAGRQALKQMLKKPTLEQFFALSKSFTLKSGLASPWVLDVLEAVEAEGNPCSMVMLGECVFALGTPETLSEFGSPRVCYLDTHGAGLG